ncbi:MAG: hypothetical protein NVS4B12_24500 [Ktedonobacteraceae bacterium]
MSQEYSSSKRARRTARSQRNKPVLVTPSTHESENVEAESSVSTATQTIAEPRLLTVPTPEPVEQPARKLPRFFSTVKKSEQDTAQRETKEAEVAQARLARATRGKAPVEVIGTVPAPAKANKPTGAESKNSTTATVKPATTRPPSLFKTRYIIGMGVYLIAADFLGLYEQRFLTYLGLEKELTRFNLFGGILHVNTSTIVFLASLVIILVLLARFDLIPRSLGGASAAKRGASQSPTKNNATTTPGERVIPPTIRQGIKGSDDTLYQQYRTSQRRQKKR